MTEQKRAPSFADIPLYFVPRFVVGQHVRINPDAVREGLPDGASWRTLLAQTGSTGTGGIVRRRMFLNRDMRCRLPRPGWGYLVVFPDLAPDGARFLEEELLEEPEDG